MEEATHVSSTDEDEVIDVEGDDIKEHYAVACDVTVHNVRDYNDSTNIGLKKQSQKRKSDDENGGKILAPPFRKVQIMSCTEEANLPKNGWKLETDQELTKWWRKVATNGGMKQKATHCGNISTEPEQIVAVRTLDPILQATKGSLESTSSDKEKYYTEAGEEFYPPQEEEEIPFNVISAAEREHFPEYFNGRTKYTPDKYVSIRNAILDLWKKGRPNHVYKVALRPVLKKDCGNVNNVGRIHRYLESIGAINYGSENVWWKRKKAKRKEPEKRNLLGTDEKLKRALEQRMSARSRKKPAQFTPETAEDDLIGGYTIDHGNNDAIVLPVTPPKPTKPSPSKNTMKQYDLVNCRQYPTPEDCPYDVTIDASALVIMDTHSHLSKHEVMGLLGGYINFASDNTKRVEVHIVCAQPCKSVGSTRHCEMDPVSQSIACEHISTRGQKVVGWYHSHPTFPPQPSNTDIKTQIYQQAMFNSCGSVFLGLILSPYNRHQLKTQVNVVFISGDLDPVTGYEIPYSLVHKINPDPPDLNTDAFSEIIRILTEIVDDSTREAKASTNFRLPHLLEPVVQGSGISHLDKLMKSLSSFVTSQKSNLDEDTLDGGNETLHNGNVTSQEQTDITNVDKKDAPTVMSHWDDFTSCDVIEHCFHDETMDSSVLDDDFTLFGENLCIEGGPSQIGLAESVKESGMYKTAASGNLIRSQNNISPIWMNILDQIRTLLLRSHQEFLCQ